MTWDEDRVRREFARLNRRYFGGRLLEPDTVRFYGGRSSTMDLHALAEVDVMRDDAEGEFSVDLRLRRLTGVAAEMDAYWLSNLAHEMNHLYVGVDAQHGPKWRAGVRRLARLGLLEELL